MKTGVHASKTRLSRLLDVVDKREHIVIERDGHPIARLVPASRFATQLGAMRGQYVMVEGWERAMSDGEADAFWSGCSRHSPVVGRGDGPDCS